MPVVLVTGASGFLASYVIDAFLATPGWTVRGTVRSLPKAQFLLDRYPTGFELTEVTDVIDDKEGLAAAMKGVDAIAHTASPYALTVTDPMRDFINPAVEGTLSVLRAAKEAGIKRVVVTSSFAAVTDFNKGGAWREYNYTDSDWNPTTLEEACEDGRAGAFVYSASKKLAEKAALDFGEKNGLEVVTLNPPMIYGPPLQAVPSLSSLNTSSSAIYALISGPSDRPVPVNRLPLFCSVQDVALAHVKAVEDDKKVGGHRFLLCGGKFTWEDAVAHLQVARPALIPRLPSLPSVAPDAGRTIATLDCSPSHSLLGMPEYMNWKTTLETTIDALLEMEKAW